MPLSPSAELDIRDAEGHRVPDGVDGEIHVRSPYLMRGHWRDEAATRVGS
jgi:non-ribosomal peptide synthetase component E (peptide arylation enzyme)